MTQKRQSGAVQSPPSPAPEPEPTSEAAPEVLPEAAPEVLPEAAPEVLPEAAPETAPEAAPEVALEATPESAPTCVNAPGERDARPSPWKKVIRHVQERRPGPDAEAYRLWKAWQIVNAFVRQMKCMPPSIADGSALYDKLQAIAANRKRKAAKQKGRRTQRESLIRRFSETSNERDFGAARHYAKDDAECASDSAASWAGILPYPGHASLTLMVPL